METATRAPKDGGRGVRVPRPPPSGESTLAQPGIIVLVTEPILRATDATGEVYDDPSEDALYMLLEDMKTPGSVIRIERLEDDRRGEWAQVAVNDAGLYAFDSSHHVGYTSSLRNVHEFLTRWAFDLPPTRRQMPPSDPKHTWRIDDDTHVWIDGDGGITVKVVTAHGDPVELSSSEVRLLAQALIQAAGLYDED
jgi:hypothetical protein